MPGMTTTRGQSAATVALVRLARPAATYHRRLAAHNESWETLRAAIVRAHDAGASVTEIALVSGVSRQAIYRALRAASRCP